MIFIGIDPGYGGAIAIYDNGFKVVKMPKQPKEIHELLQNYEGAWVMIETQQMRTEDTKRMFSIAKLMKNYNYIVSVCQILKFNVRFIQAREWQKKFNLPKDYNAKKKELNRLAKERYPRLKPTLKTCDAILILEHLRLTTYEK
jgi:hypothetical protein